MAKLQLILGEVHKYSNKKEEVQGLLVELEGEKVLLGEFEPRRAVAITRLWNE